MSDLPLGPLQGVRVIEFGQLLAGPFCGQLLADFGAEVIKVEAPRTGDPLRDWGRERAGGRALWFPIVGRNKQSITIDLRREAGQDLARQLIATADIVVENFRPGTMEKMGAWAMRRFRPRTRASLWCGSVASARPARMPAAPVSARSARPWVACAML